MNHERQGRYACTTSFVTHLTRRGSCVLRLVWVPTLNTGRLVRGASVGVVCAGGNPTEGSIQRPSSNLRRRKSTEQDYGRRKRLFFVLKIEKVYSRRLITVHETPPRIVLESLSDFQEFCAEYSARVCVTSLVLFFRVSGVSRKSRAIQCIVVTFVHIEAPQTTEMFSVGTPVSLSSSPGYENYVTQLNPTDGA